MFTQLLQVTVPTKVAVRAVDIMATSLGRYGFKFCATNAQGGNEDTWKTGLPGITAIYELYSFLVIIMASSENESEATSIVVCPENIRTLIQSALQDATEYYKSVPM